MKFITFLILCIMSSVPACAATYYMSATGSDSNKGTSSSPWASPNHAVNCGDVIIASAGVYSNLQSFGQVTCPSANNVAWLTCASFDACEVNTNSGTAGMLIQSSFWGVQGWEVHTGGNEYMTCILIAPGTGSPATATHHVIVANNIANGCEGAGIGVSNWGQTVALDYIAIIGNIVSNAAVGGGECYSGISIYQPIALNTASGTHIFIAGNFSFGNVDADPCGGGTPTDGEGIILDDFNGSQQSNLSPYTQQTVVEDNIVSYNGGAGIEVGSSNEAEIYIIYNTAYGNFTDRNQNDTSCGQINIAGYPNVAGNTMAYVNIRDNLAMPSGKTEPACGGNPAYVLYVYNTGSNNSAATNFGYSAGGYNTAAYSSPSFSYGSNSFGTNPSFTNPVKPVLAAFPACKSYSNVPACMATVIHDFTPTASGASSYGWQQPSSEQTYSSIYPQWLCDVTLPSGLVTNGCED